MVPDRQGAYKESVEVVIVMKRETSPLRVAILGGRGGGTKGLWGSTIGVDHFLTGCPLRTPTSFPVKEEPSLLFRTHRAIGVQHSKERMG